MTFFLLIRHAMCAEVGRKFAGRMPDVHLNEEGRAQALRLAERLRDVRLDGVASSPLERARETALPLAQGRGLAVTVSERLTEIDTGEWTGCEFRNLSGLKRWESFNVFRSCIRPPGGELMLEAQVRIIAELELLRERYCDGNIAVVSHGDVIKSAIAHYAGVPLDLFRRIEISPCSVSIVSLDDSGPTLLRINDNGSLPDVLKEAR